MAWIELHQTLREHKKMFACADALNLSRIEMIGTLVSLWLWALDNAQDGSLAGVSDRTIARVCDFPEKKAGKLISALTNYGWLDYDGEHYEIHDWYDYAGKLMERREKDRKRKGKPSGTRSDFRGNSDGNPEDFREISHATVPNRTLPYPTAPNISGGAGDIARAREATVEELSGIGIKPGEFPGLTSGFVEEVRSTADELYRKYIPTRKVMACEYRQVARYCGDSGRAQLLDYAFEKASVSCRSGDWRYINGIMDKLFARGIETEAQARMWDEERPDLEEEG